VLTAPAHQRVIVVLDARHGIKVNDREMLRFLADAHVKFQVVLNKTDEVVPNDLCRRWSLVMEELGKLRGAHPIVHMVSTATGAGIAPLAAELCQLAKAAPAKPQAADAAGDAAKPALSLAMRPQPGDASLGKLPRKAALSNLGEDLPRRASRDRLEAALRELQVKGRDDDV
jgi:predicted GTPase